MASKTGSSGSQRPALLQWFRADTMEGVRRQRAILGYLFLLPTIVGLVAFVVGPMFISFGLSLFKWNIFKPPEFIGLVNFDRLIHDARVFTTFRNTFLLGMGTLVILEVLAMMLALAVHKVASRAFATILRTSYFLPVLMSGAAVAVTLGYLFHKEFGVINYYLGLLGVERIPWLTSGSVVLWTIIITAVWRNLGFTFIIYLGGVSNMPKEVLEAADVDGAQGWRRFWNVTLPLLSPTILFATVTDAIRMLQFFDEPWLMARGGPGDSSRTVVMIMYETAFQNREFGYGSAIAIVLFTVIMIVTGLQFALSRRWVFYRDE